MPTDVILAENSLFTLGIHGETPMGSEHMEMRKRQMSVQQESMAGGTALTQQDPNQSQNQGNQSQVNQSQVNQNQVNQSQVNQNQGNQSQVNQRGNNACCFCWCCCCSCSWNEEREERNRRASYDLKAEGTADCEDRPPPTLEEVRSWAQSFDRLMSCAAGRVAFRLFLCTEFSEENMLFWLACEEFTKETNKTSIEEKARVIYEDYISILSPKEVSLDSRVREVINKNMLEPSSQTFVDAQVQIYTLMQRDSYPRYMNSPAYMNLLNSLSEQAPES
ncbi:regulator of G-protein signaling 20-like isoform X2 [Coregonus clupeaformis]|uniref:regulator of G-protein signaling 20-like isoform X2 n=1 Tax=Coregonus clupeaformis TaxID=59861 RepID=UPI001BE0B48B|nr:regulator of G-protein signaling 20-like isoform X2 [Coregonus clupeaformis]